jgi:hypothetical protein
MKATGFEYRHQLVIHEFILGAAVLTYLLDREDIIWRFVKTSSNGSRPLERALFASATLLFGTSAWLCTRARAHHLPHRKLYLGEYIYALALASLVPLAGSLILVTGEGLRIFRLLLRGVEPSVKESLPTPEWRGSLRRESIKWGLFITMIVFTITLRDRVAEILIGTSILFWILLNLRLSAACADLRMCLVNRRA